MRNSTTIFLQIPTNIVTYFLTALNIHLTSNEKQTLLFIYM